MRVTPCEDLLSHFDLLLLPWHSSKPFWSQFALLLLLGAFAKTKEAALRLMCGCLRQRFAFCFVAEDFLSLFLHFFVSSLEIPFDKQVYNSYLHKIRNSTWQIALLLFSCTKTLFPFWGIKHQRSQCSVGAFGTTKSPLPTYFTFLLRLRLKKTFKKSCISFLNLWSMKRRFPAPSDKLIFNCRHL